MRIISNFQDYYDSIQQYGIDNNIVLNRINKSNYKFNTEPNSWHFSYPQSEFDIGKKSLLLKFENDCADFRKIEKLEYFFEDYHFPYNLHQVVAVINGKAYKNYILTKKDNFNEKIVSKNTTSLELYNLLQDNISLLPSSSSFKYKHFLSFKNYDDFVKEKSYSFKFKPHENTSFATSENLYKIHKELDTPIFFILDKRAFLSNIPLAYLGFNKLFNGNIEAVSQEISYCIGNVLQNKNEPPIAIDDNVKIEQHGFDKKKSFRHR